MHECGWSLQMPGLWMQRNRRISSIGSSTTASFWETAWFSEMWISVGEVWSQGRLAGSVARACYSWSRGRDFETKHGTIFFSVYTVVAFPETNQPTQCILKMCENTLSLKWNSNLDADINHEQFFTRAVLGGAFAHVSQFSLALVPSAAPRCGLVLCCSVPEASLHIFIMPPRGCCSPSWNHWHQKKPQLSARFILWVPAWIFFWVTSFAGSCVRNEAGWFCFSFSGWCLQCQQTLRTCLLPLILWEWLCPIKDFVTLPLKETEELSSLQWIKEVRSAIWHSVLKCALGALNRFIFVGKSTVCDGVLFPEGGAVWYKNY